MSDQLEPTIFEKSSKGKEGYSFQAEEDKLPETDSIIDDSYLRDEIENFPELSEVEIARHYTRISKFNHGVDDGLYPLGSCTMKYNPKINEDLAQLEGFTSTHPLHPADMSQGNLEIMYELGEALKTITGMDGVSLQPAAGAHGELTGMLMIRKYFENQDKPRKTVLIPDTAHGTNPASAHFAGYKVEEIESNEDGIIEPGTLKDYLNEDVAALMVTNPNTLGIFEQNIKEITNLLHENGSLIYCDGANLNALMGKYRPGDSNIDVMHLNLHKTFSTPHGGGGPGSGPIVVDEKLIPYLPIPTVEKDDNEFYFDYDHSNSIGKMRAFYGNFGVMVKALAYILTTGAEGLKKVAEHAVLNSNYIRNQLEEDYDIPYDSPTMHEVIFSNKSLKDNNVKTMQAAKRLMDFGFHPPTVYFPLVVDGAMMIEPTETESLRELDYFIEAMKKIIEEAEHNPEKLKSAPHTTPIGRLDTVHAARNPILTWKPDK